MNSIRLFETVTERESAELNTEDYTLTYTEEDDKTILIIKEIDYSKIPMYGNS